jgi:hypothetical protein
MAQGLQVTMIIAFWQDEGWGLLWMADGRSAAALPEAELAIAGAAAVTIAAAVGFPSSTQLKTSEIILN